VRHPAALALLLVLALASCGKRGDSVVVHATPGPVAVERQTFSDVNAYRARKRLPALAWNELIADQARRHSLEMASGKARFGHGGFSGRLATIGRVISWRQAAENVAVDRTVDGAMELWLKSRGHRKDIEGDFDLTGVGTARGKGGSIYFTQIFIKSR
jgi:uncharacterized protein YkwD